MDQWKIRVNDIYPAYIDWATFERIQAMLQDNYAEYDRNKTRGVPAPGQGAAARHRLLWRVRAQDGGAVQRRDPLPVQLPARSSTGSRSARTSRPTPSMTPWWRPSSRPSPPVELDVYAQAVAAEQARRSSVDQAQQQHLERLRYQADLAERQFTRVDPDNRLVAAELERRWEAALSALKEAEDAVRSAAAASPRRCPCRRRCGRALQAGGAAPPAAVAPGQSSARPSKKALLRCLIDKVVVQRSARDRVQARIVWRGGETTTAAACR